MSNYSAYLCSTVRITIRTNQAQQMLATLEDRQSVYSSASLPDCGPAEQMAPVPPEGVSV